MTFNVSSALVRSMFVVITFFTRWYLTVLGISFATAAAAAVAAAAAAAATVRLMGLYCIASAKDARKIVRPCNENVNVILAAAEQCSLYDGTILRLAVTFIICASLVVCVCKQ